MIVPIRLKPVELHVHADRRLAFQVLTAFGARQKDGSSSTVLRDEGDRKLVEFHSVIPTFGRGRKTYRTVEWVTLLEPAEIRFEGVEGPLALLQDRFVLRDVQGCTLFRYESTFGMKGGVAGWLKGQSLVRPVLGRFMRVHSLKLKETIEARARSSRVYPLPTCGAETPGGSMRRALRFFAIGALVASVPLLPPARAASQEGRLTMTSRVPFARVAQALERAIADQRMALVCHANAQRGAAARGVEIKGNQVLMVFRNDFAVRLLAADPEAGFEAPIRIYLYENPDGTATVSYLPPTAVFARYRHPEVQAVARELDPIFKTIVARGVAGS